MQRRARRQPFGSPNASHGQLNARWLAPDEIARHLGITVEQVLEHIARRGLPAFRVGDVWRMKLAEVDDWVRRGAGDPQGAPAARDALEPPLEARADHDTSAEERSAAALDPRLNAANERFASADFEAVVALTGSLAIDALASVDVRWQAAMLRLRALIKLSRFDDALAFADGLVAPDPAREVECATQRVRLRIEKGDFAEANTELERLCYLPHGLADADAARVASYLAYIGNYRASARFVPQLAASTAHFVKISLLGVYIEGGAVSAARELARSLPVRDRETQGWLDECEIPLSIFSGEMRELEQKIAALSLRASASSAQPCWVDAVTLATLRGREATHELTREDIPRPTGYQGNCLAIELLRNRTRHGRVRDADALASPRASDPAWLRVRDAVVCAERALLAGDTGAALGHGRAALSVATASDGLPLVFEAWSTLIDVLLCRGDLSALHEAQAALLAVAQRSGSARVAAEARWLAALLAEEANYLAFEAAATEIDCSPIAARRARSLLGGSPPLDAVDRVVLDALRARFAPRRVRVLRECGEPWRGGWCYDRASRRVLLSDGTAHDFSTRSVQRAILDVLFSRKEASKEALVREVWGVRDYHPLKHDKRLHLAVHTLRENLESQHASPTRIVTTLTGYALGGSERVLEVLENDR